MQTKHTTKTQLIDLLIIMALKNNATSMGVVLLALMVMSIIMSSSSVYAHTSNNALPLSYFHLLFSLMQRKTVHSTCFMYKKLALFDNIHQTSCICALVN
jgi:hypothetical protein